MQFTDKIYGNIAITEPVVLALIETPQMQRLKKIHQYGIFHYFDPRANTTRFEHSLGVYLVLNNFGASLEEQIAGLLHDISHGVFSHVMDRLYGSLELEDYQDNLHKQYFTDTAVNQVLINYGFDPARISDLSLWPLADNELPEICADRLQYTLGDAVTINKISPQQAKRFIDCLVIEKNQFIFTNKEIAREFADLSLWMCKNFWHPNWGHYCFLWLAAILRQAMDKKIITKEDLATDDDSVIEKLENCLDKGIIDQMAALKHFRTDKVVENQADYDFLIEKTKLRVIDPRVNVGGKQKRITELYPDFKEKFDSEKAWVNHARYLKYAN
ncbi:MAG: HD domain-containing protein [Patescibacteria group bacterium]|jgi:hypothetical protein